MSKAWFKQEQILSFIVAFMQANHGHAPTYREIQSGLKISSTSVVKYHIDKLEEAGLIQVSRNKSRLITVVGEINQSPEALQKRALPLTGSTDGKERPKLTPERGVMRGLEGRQTLRIPFCGLTAAGEPLPHRMDADPESKIEISPVMLGNYSNRPDEIIALKVRGDSMIEAGILNGDIVLIKTQPTAERGEKVVVWLEQEGAATLKRWYPSESRNRVCLRSANPAVKPIYMPLSNARIVGKYLSSMRLPSD
jgi:repressor LexA